MSNDFQLNATARNDLGKGASRRLRRISGETPAIIYGGKNAPESISILAKDLAKALENEAFYSHIITLVIDGKSQDAILKDLQRHPAKDIIMHADFLRVSKNQKLTTNVPLHFTNEETSIGVKQEGGIVSHTMTELEIQCLPADLPEFIEIDLAELKLGETVHISDIKLPKGVESVALSHGEDHDLLVATIIKPKSVAVDDADVDAADTDVDGDAEDTATDEGKEETNGE